MKNDINLLTTIFVEYGHNIALLLERVKGISFNSIDREGNNLLHYYSKSAAKLDFNRNEIVDLLIQNGININQPQKGGKKLTPLHRAVLHNDCELCKVLIEKGAVIDSLDANGGTPLFTAVMDYRGGDGSIISFLIKKGADTQYQNHFGNSPVSMAHTIVNYNLMQFFK